MKEPFEDPIVAEVRAIRQEIWAQFDHDFDKLFAYLKAKQATSGRKYVSFPPRRITPPTTVPPTEESPSK